MVIQKADKRNALVIIEKNDHMNKLQNLISGSSKLE